MVMVFIFGPLRCGGDNRGTSTVFLTLASNAVFSLSFATVRIVRLEPHGPEVAIDGLPATLPDDGELFSVALACFDCGYNSGVHCVISPASFSNYIQSLRPSHASGKQCLSLVIFQGRLSLNC